MQLRKLFSKLLVFVMLIAMLPTTAFASGYNDTGAHWASTEIAKWSDMGILMGSDGNFKPNLPITRAEMAVILDRMMHYQITAKNTFLDLKDTWYTQAMLRANASGIILGSNGKVRPMDYISRQEASVMLCRALGLKEASGATTFADDAGIASWAKGYVKALSSKGLISGMGKNQFAPTASINRASVVKLLDNAIKQIYGTAGEYSTDVNGNVVISVAGVTLKNMTIHGDLIIAEGVGNGDVKLDNITIKGNTVVRGGGKNSIYFNSVTVEGAMIVNKVGGDLRIVATGTTSVSVVTLESGAIIVTKDLIGGGVQQIVIPASFAAGQNVVLDGNFKSVENNALNINIEATGKIENLILNEKTEVTGNAVIASISTAPGADSVVNGQDVAGGQSAAPSTPLPTPTPVGSGGGGGNDSTPASVTLISVSVTGSASVADTLSATAAYTGGAGSVTYQWYSATSNDKSGEAAIESATAVDYTVGLQDVGRYIYVRATASGTTLGSAVDSTPVGPVIQYAAPKNFSVTSRFGSEFTASDIGKVELTATLDAATNVIYLKDVANASATTGENLELGATFSTSGSAVILRKDDMTTTSFVGEVMPTGSLATATGGKYQLVQTDVDGKVVSTGVVTILDSHILATISVNNDGVTSRAITGYSLYKLGSSPSGQNTFEVPVNASSSDEKLIATLAQIKSTNADTIVFYDSAVSTGNLPTSGNKTNPIALTVSACNTIISSDSLVDAQWQDITTATYTVTFESNGGSAVGSISGVESGAIISAPANPTKSIDGQALVFQGWYTDADLTVEWDFATDIVQADIILYAKWSGWQPPVALDARFEVGYPNATIVDDKIVLNVQLKDVPLTPVELFVVVTSYNTHFDASVESVIHGHTGEDQSIHVQETPYLLISDNEVHTISTNVGISDSSGAKVFFVLREGASISSEPTLLNFEGLAATELDSWAPGFMTAYVNGAKDKVTLHFDEQLDADSVPAASAFTIEGQATATVNHVEIVNTSYHQSKVILTLSTPLESITELNVTYTQPEVNPLQDTATVPNKVETIDETTWDSDVKVATVEAGVSHISYDGRYMTFEIEKAFYADSMEGDLTLQVKYGTEAGSAVEVFVDSNPNYSWANDGSYVSFMIDLDTHTPTFEAGKKYFVTLTMPEGTIDYAGDAVTPVVIEGTPRDTAETAVSPTATWDEIQKRLTLDFGVDTLADESYAACGFTIIKGGVEYILRGFTYAHEGLLEFEVDNLPFDLDLVGSTISYIPNRHTDANDSSKLLYMSGKPFEGFQNIEIH